MINKNLLTSTRWKAKQERESKTTAADVAALIASALLFAFFAQWGLEIWLTMPY